MPKPELTTMRTMFEYRNQEAYFQIFVDSENSTLLAGEFDNYEAYKAAFDHLFAALSQFNSAQKPVQEKNFERPHKKIFSL